MLFQGPNTNFFHVSTKLLFLKDPVEIRLTKVTVENTRYIRNKYIKQGLL